MVRAMPAPVRLMVFEGFGRSRYGEVVYLPLLRPRMVSPAVPKLRAYLWAAFENKHPSERKLFDLGDKQLFDDELRQAVERFQTLESLSVDGVVGKDTWTRLFQIVTPEDTVVVGSGGGSTGGGGDQGNKDEGNFPLTVPGKNESSPVAAFVVAGAAALAILWAINKGGR